MGIYANSIAHGQGVRRGMGVERRGLLLLLLLLLLTEGGGRSPGLDPLTWRARGGGLAGNSP